MQNPTDERILEVLDTGLMLGPTAIAKNIDKHRVTVSGRLRELRKYGLVECPEEGYYEITDLGKQYLEGELNAGELEPVGDTE
ncbi:ArsR/SmtB family transcription factor [Natrialba taiwanensis]|uniref:PhiH1 repressor-like protein n=1 Tax=Natrialba taiwanensis DSM 12281 TaxID=1230458 RepID=L9ZJD4_9EURY|nr:helix-turn-helix transcriptional regulator [Natrialba taiwanensis]ELY86151.1 PhiH1 repressor-like protein [Natrialba taiwanensis DSM 12281]